MSEYAYYPGCALFTKARNLDQCARLSAEALGVQLKEMPTWNCCGAIFSTVGDDLASQVGPIRNLALASKLADDERRPTPMPLTLSSPQRGEEEGGVGVSRRESAVPAPVLVTLCAACFNVLKRSQAWIAKPGNEQTRDRFMNFIEEDVYGTTDEHRQTPMPLTLPSPQRGEERAGAGVSRRPSAVDVRVLHYLEIMKNDVGFEAVKARVRKGLGGLKLGSYYGCLMVRPEAEMQFDSVDNPMMMDDLMAALGATPVYFPFKTECCGGYLLVNNQDASLKCAGTIISSLNAAGAEAVVTTCPLCQYNVDQQQKILAERVSGFKKLPVFYFTQLLALALGIEGDVLNLDRHYVDPKPLLKAKGLL